MPTLKTTQGTLFYAQRGKGTPVLVGIHGAGGTHQHWGYQLGSLAEHTQVVLLDLPGHGRADGPGCKTIADYGATLLAALDALEVEQVILAGHSMGGATALWTALEAPQRVTGLVLTSTGAKLRVAPAILDAFGQAYEAGVKMIVDGVYDESAAPDLKMAGELGFMQVPPDVFRDDLLACDAFDVRSRLHEIGCPVLVLCGNNDQMTPLKFSTSLYEGIAGSELVTFDQAGHMVMLEQPQAVNDAIVRWFTSRYRSG
jgi:pimeloyl-ACP methyl ester carboxylesterase